MSEGKPEGVQGVLMPPDGGLRFSEPTEPPKTEKFLAQMDFFRGGGKNYHRITLRFYPTPEPEDPDVDDPRPFIAKDLKGREVNLTTEEIESAKPFVFPKR